MKDFIFKETFEPLTLNFSIKLHESNQEHCLGLFQKSSRSYDQQYNHIGHHDTKYCTVAVCGLVILGTQIEIFLLTQ